MITQSTIIKRYFWICLIHYTINTTSNHILHIQKFIETVIRVAFFVTPIIWEPTSGTVRETVAFYNPFTYVIALFRTPIIEGRYDFNALIVVLAITFVLWVFALVAMRVLRAQLPYRL